MEIRTKGQRQPPWLLTSYGVGNDKHSFYNVVENRFHVTSIPELRGKYICASTYGWLVLVNPSGDCCIWNPESMEKIELPNLPYPLDYTNCVLSKPPRDPDCYILFTSDSCRTFCQVGVDNEFFIEQLEAGGWFRIMSVATFKGNIYGILKDSFVTVHFVDGALELRPIEPWKFPHHLSAYYHARYKDYMIESPCKDELLLVHQFYSTSYRYNVFGFKIYRLDMCKMECEELESIGDRAIFLSGRGGGECCFSTEGIKANCIYYTELNGRKLHVYDLNDNGKTLLLPCPAARRSQSVNFWIEHQISQKFVNTKSK
ncbi:hypothetical protein ACJIZ3_018589 [Penstemon smallii]|uniref:KIB1-4 beta-propeller domain-containing protein n=1 Tax=Penstemon smallii TaxID=265156 RepID=A0ABD3SYS6_9LAMI